jgi:hypothetical protein
VIDEFGASAYFFDAAGPLTLTLAAHDDQAVDKVRLYLDEEEIESNLTLADFPYVYDVLSAKYNGNERRFKVEVHDAEGLTAAAETMPITITLPDSGAERCIFEDPDKGTVLSVISAIEYTPEAIFAVGTRALKMAVWKLDPDNCSLLPGWPKTIANWTGDNTFKGLTSLGAAVDEDEDGNIVVGGNFLVNGKPQAYAALLTDDGARLWERAGSPGDRARGCRRRPLPAQQQGVRRRIGVHERQPGAHRRGGLDLPLRRRLGVRRAADHSQGPVHPRRGRPRRR